MSVKIFWITAGDMILNDVRRVESLDCGIKVVFDDGGNITLQNVKGFSDAS